jgi:hypothetical protein
MERQRVLNNNDDDVNNDSNENRNNSDYVCKPIKDDLDGKNNLLLRPYTFAEIASFTLQERSRKRDAILSSGSNDNSTNVKLVRRRHVKTHGKIGFAELARHIAARWKTLSDHEKSNFRTCFKIELDYYRSECKKWMERNKNNEKEENDDDKADDVTCISISQDATDNPINDRISVVSDNVTTESSTDKRKNEVEGFSGNR